MEQSNSTVDGVATDGVVQSMSPRSEGKTRDERIKRIETFSEWLDSAFEVPIIGYRVGWDTVIGLAPGVGDLATTAMSGWIINEARQLGVSRWTLLRMLANSGFDFLVGIVPIAGDLLDATFRSNIRNLTLLKAAIERQPADRETHSSSH